MFSNIISSILAWCVEKCFGSIFRKKSKSVAEDQAQLMAKPERSWADDINKL